MAPRQSRWLKVRGSSGPYAVVRHPMYGWALIMMLEIPLALGSWWGLVIVMPASAEIIVRLLDEERFLARLWACSDYMRKVPYRLLPHVW